VFQLMLHLLAIVRLPPAAVGVCVSAWPAGVQSLAHDTTIWQENSTWPSVCVEAWTLNALSKSPKNKSDMFDMTFQQLHATQNSKLLDLLWKLPDGCLNLHPRSSEDGTAWFCDDDEEGDSDCAKSCELSDATMALLIGAALSDAASAFGLNCDSAISGGDLMKPQMMDTYDMGTADLVMKTETLQTDLMHLSQQLEGTPQSHENLPPGKCSAQDFLGDKKAHEPYLAVLQPGLANMTQAEIVLKENKWLQRWLCAVYYHDFVCGGYELLEGCQDPTMEWLPVAMKEVLSNTLSTARYAEV